MVNKITLLGNVGKEPEVVTFENGNKVAKFSLATSESYKDKNDEWEQKTQWHNVTVWKPSEKICSLTKGATLYIEGKIIYGKYTTKDGVEKYFTEIIASNVKVIVGAKSEQRDTNVPATNETFDILNPPSSFADDLPF